MKQLLFLLLFISCFQFKAQLLPAEKIAQQLESIIKADSIKLVSVFFYKPNTVGFSDEIRESAYKFKFDGQFFVVMDYEKIQKYYNLNKLINFMVLKKQGKLHLFFEAM